MEKAWINCNAEECGNLKNGRCSLNEIQLDVKTGACLSFDPEENRKGDQNNDASDSIQ